MSRAGTAVDAMLARSDLFRFDDDQAPDAMLSRPDLLALVDDTPPEEPRLHRS